MSTCSSFLGNNGKFRQFVAAIIINLLSITYGISLGWPSPIIPQLRSNNTPVGNEPMTVDQISWIGSVFPLGGLMAVPLCGLLSERLGRKKFALLTGLPHIISWLLIIFAQNYIYLYIARVFVGMAASMTVFVVPLYVGEIASDDIRGILGCLLLFSINIGVVFAYVAGAFLSYGLFASLSLLLPILFLLAFSFMPESPIYLLRRDRQVEACKSLIFFRGNNELLVEPELIRLKSQVDKSTNLSRNISLKDLFKDRATRKGLIIAIGLLAGQQFSGIFAMISHAETIFKRAGTSLSASTASIIVALIQFVGSSMSTMLMDRTGRRLLTLYSCIGMTISHSIVGLFFYLHKNKYQMDSFSWLPLIALSFYFIMFCLGIKPVSIVIISEVFRLDHSSLAATVCLVFFWIIAFFSMKVFDLAMKFLGDDGCFFMLAAFCACCFIFSYCMLLETKGRKREDIIDELAGVDKSLREKANGNENIVSKVLVNSELARNIE